MKELLVEAGVPTARHATFTDPEMARSFLQTLAPPYVVKTDGLAGGKGVLVTDSFTEAAADIESKLAGETFGEAGRKIVIEEGLAGPEVSVLCVCDGKRAVALAPAQDYKRLGDGDTGPNTGGMGAYSPVPAASDAVVQDVVDKAVAPTLGLLADRGIDYRGVLYAGLMLTAEGPKVLEFNVRFGDPEAQVVLPRFTGDFTEFLVQAASGKLKAEPHWRAEAAVTVTLASEGYPSTPRMGELIEGLARAEQVEGATVYCAGVERDSAGHMRTAGGRVLSVTGIGREIEDARRAAYEAITHISWPGMQYRRDIAEIGSAGVGQ